MLRSSARDNNCLPPRKHAGFRGFSFEKICLVLTRFADYRTYKLCCIGAPRNSTIAIGTHGCMKSLESRKILEDGLTYVFSRLQPKNLVIYGTVSSFIVNLCKENNTKLFVFQSDFGKSHSVKKEVI